MFTGIVEEIGKIGGISRDGVGMEIKVCCSAVLDGTKIGDSISTKGVCLTVKELGKDFFKADVMGETINKSNLGILRIGDRVNLERALRITDRIGGHIVSGHIDGKGSIVQMKKEGSSYWISVQAGKEILKYIILKGSIAIDGISLTVAEVNDEIFKVSIIPHTSKETTLISNKIGDKVNLECDVIGKYVEKLFGRKEKEGGKEEVSRGIDEGYLMKYGFM